MINDHIVTIGSESRDLRSADGAAGWHPGWVHRFVDDDAGYLRWNAAHPDGYVVNVPRGDGSGGPRMLHRAICRTITGTPSRGSVWTGPYIKVCGELEELETAYAPGSLTACALCVPTRQAAGSHTTFHASARGAMTADEPSGLILAPPAARIWPTRFLRPSSQPVRLPVRPRLASWDRSDHPSQIELERFLTATAELLLPKINDLSDPLALRLDVGLPAATPLLDAHDLDNYLFPLATRLARLSGREFATVWGTKQHGSDSYVRVEQAVEDHTPGDFTAVRLVDVRAAGGSLAFKQQIHDQLRELVPLLDGPVALQIAFVIPGGRNWATLWKPSIDSLDPLLGRTRPDRGWHPQDGRVVELALHRHVRDATTRHVTIAIGATPIHPRPSVADG